MRTILQVLSDDEITRVHEYTLKILAETGVRVEDNGFLLKGDVFTKDAIDMWIEYKTDNEVNPVKLRPHPHEFFLYYDI